MTPIELFYENRGLNTVKQLRLRHFDAQYCKTAEEAKAAALALIAPEQTVGWGGSVTVDALGIKDVLRQRGQTLFDRDVAKTPESKIDITEVYKVVDEVVRDCLEKTFERFLEKHFGEYKRRRGWTLQNYLIY